ncbi:MAG TPA: ABC transporter ATP-binding protein [Campylobacterales bacterium]|nr:ABC transporter ATP-binding protein [Campylobacterales bacterium]
MFFGITATAIATVATAHIIKPILDDIFINRDVEKLHIIPIFLVFIYLVKSVGRYFQTYFTAKIGESIVMRLRNEMLQKILELDMEYINSVRNGELISRINNDILRVRYIVSDMFPELSREIVTILGLVAYVIYQSPILSFWTLVILPATFYPLSILAKKMKATSKRSQEKSADIVSKLTELFNNIEIIKSNSTEKVELEKFQEENRNFFHISLRGVKIFGLVSPMMEVYSSLSIALVIIFGGEAVINGEMSVGSFFSFLTAVGLLFDPIKKVSAIFNKMQDGISATERIIELLNIENRIQNGTEKISDIQKIEFQQVSFLSILNNISFSISKGEKIAFVGDSGGGKTTTINLLMRFYDRDSGYILLDGQKIENIQIESLRRNIAIVSQRVYIFNDTILNNVAYGSDEVDSNRAVKALKMVEAWEFVSKMEKGIYTQLQEFGANLSGGERQRIALARAIYQDSPVLILDEATSALDNRVEKKIFENLQNYFKNRIVIIIAHRLSTIEDSDRIYLFSNGKIVGVGTHQELLEHSPEYRRLHNR